MQKVEGSNPFSRFLESLLAERVLAFQGLVGGMADEIPIARCPDRPARLALIYASHGAIAAATMTG
jgi:hypothetical protein